MFEYKKGNILLEHADAVVNTVNCMGIMGKGIALQFKKMYPENFKEYQNACKNENVILGKMFIVNSNSLTQPKYIVNFPTKKHWKSNSSMKDIENGLLSLAQDIKKLEIKSIAIPPIGCGLGGLNWFDVRRKIETILGKLHDVKIIVFEPTNEQFITTKNSICQPKLTPARAALIGLIDQYLQVLLDPFLTLLEIHKLMYFMQEAGEDLKLRFSKAKYGPYAENLRHVLNMLEGYYLDGYSDADDNPKKIISLIDGASECAKKNIRNDLATLNNFQKVSKLVNGFESSFGLELLSTVHWVIKKEGAKSMNEIIKAIYAWNNRKQLFTKEQITIAYTTLLNQGWINH